MRIEGFFHLWYIKWQHLGHWVHILSKIFRGKKIFTFCLETFKSQSSRRKQNLFCITENCITTTYRFAKAKSSVGFESKTKKNAIPRKHSMMPLRCANIKNLRRQPLVKISWNAGNWPSSLWVEEPPALVKQKAGRNRISFRNIQS
jgi:hypothetical protein